MSCSRCGRPACPECLRPAAVGQHCVACLQNDGVDRATVRPQFGDRGIRPMVARPLVASRPIATYALIAINVVVFAICIAEAGGLQVLNSPLFLDWSLYKPAIADGQYWRLFTSGFLHLSVIHIAGNMLALYILGRDLELALGIPRYVAVYVTSLFGGSAFVMLFESDTAVTAGASGAIYGLMGAILVVLLKARLSPVPVLSIIGLNIVLSIAIPGISIWAHIGGLVFGAVATAGIVFAPGLLGGSSRPSAKTASIIGWVTIAVLFVLAVGICVGIGLDYSNPTVLVR
ncbi:rhomboid family intramembrane serine protease [Gordonia soli]|uniref:rhomboid family intramembrane serine protease n=1 Tax=Gordonia soli TaxID=320799 RepID=UPI003F71234A